MKTVLDLRDYKNWDYLNGTLSVSLEPNKVGGDSSLYVVLNGNTGNFCLDYTREPINNDLAKQRSWSSDTSYYLKIDSDNLIITRWWDNLVEKLPYRKVQENPTKFYNALIKQTPQINGGVIAFSKEAFIKLRNCVTLPDNGQVSLRMFMYLLAALSDGVEIAGRVDTKKWHLKEFDPNWISSYDWDWLYSAFKKGTDNMPPLLGLILRHASNRLFQEAHREATRKEFQTALWGGADRVYDSGISDGAFYTPTSLVRTIVQESLLSLNKTKALSERHILRILDPSCGSAEFLREVLRQLKMLKYKGKIELSGWDISEIACEMSNFVLQYENLTEWDGNVAISVQQRDSLEYDWSTEKPFDIVLMNPPFSSFENLGIRKSLVLEQLKGVIKRQPDLSSVFWKKGSEVISKDGVLGIILPHSLLIAETYSKLRQHIKEDLGMDFSLIARLGSSGLFEKAMIIPAVLIGVRSNKSSSHTVLWTDHQQISVFRALRELRIYRHNDLSTPVTNNGFSIYDNPSLTNRSAWTVRSFQLGKLADKLSGISKVGKIFNVTRGADTGNNAVFILTKEKYDLLPKNEKSYFRPCVMRESIVHGRLKDYFYMFFPYGSNKLFNEKELHQRLPVYAIDLNKAKEKLSKRKGNEEYWWELSRYRPWQLEKVPKLVSAYFGKSGYFAYDSEGTYLIGQSFAWFPKKAELKDESYSYAYLALLHAPLIDRLLEMTCNILDGGYYDLSKHYIDELPMPDLSKAETGTLTLLTKLGENIHNGDSVDKSQLNIIAANVYGINLESLNFDY